MRIIALILLCCSIISCTDPRKPKNKIEENIYSAADKMIAAFKARDWSTFISYNHPNMIKNMGGISLFKNKLEEQMKDVPDTAIKQLNIDRILQVVKTSHDIQCVGEQYMLMQLQGMQVISTTYLVGESLDDGKTWTFFDASGGLDTRLKTIKPDLSPELQVPGKKQDVKRL